MAMRSGSKELQNDPEIDFNDMFSLRKPKDARAGLASGAKSIAKGVLAGAVGLVAAPAIGAHQEGIKGFAKGAAAGIAGAVILPVTGVAVGATQMFRGIANTPKAMKETASGKQWDEGMRTWIDAPSQAVAIQSDPPPGTQPWGSSGDSSSEDFYTLLGVSRTATAEEIKKQYYILARRMHPDKNPDDPEANEKFQKLGEAYQVLGNAELRQRYDAHGTEGLDVNFVDGAEFFTALFGSDRFNHLVGELMIAAAARLGSNLTPQQLKKMQTDREDELVVMLSALLRRWVEGDEDGFIDSMAAEAANLASASFGEVMLHAVGRVYKVQATIYLGNLIDGSLAALKAKGRNVKSQFKAASMAIKVYQTQQQLAKLDMAAERVKEQVDIESASRDRVTSAAAAAAARGSSTAFVAGNASSNQSENFVGSSNGGTQMYTRNEIGRDDNSTGDLAGLDSQSATHLPDSVAGQVSVEELREMAAAMAAERAKLEEQSLPLMLDAMWAANVLDIEATVRHVCKRILNDPELDKERRRSRAQGLLQLGNIFLAAADSNKANKEASKDAAASTAAAGGNQAANDAKSKMEEAMMRVLEKRMQAE